LADRRSAGTHPEERFALLNEEGLSVRTSEIYFKKLHADGFGGQSRIEMVPTILVWSCRKMRWVHQGRFHDEMIELGSKLWAVAVP
jgi:hypothetical protein